MATEKKSIEIGLRANLSQLKSQLKSIPNITEAEVKKMTAALEKELKKSEKAAEKAAKKQAQNMKKLEKATQKASKQAQGMGKAFKNSAQGAGLAAVGAVLAIATLSQGIADLTNQLVDASTKTGVSTEKLAGLRLAAEGAGLAFEDLEGGLIKLPQQMLKASQGSKAAMRSFDDLGVAVKDSSGELRSSDEVLNDVVKSLKTVEGAEKKAALAAQIFGKEAGPKFLQAGIDNLDAFTELATKFGVDVGPEATAAAADFQRQVALMGTVAKGSLQKILDAMGGDGGINAVIKHGTEAIVFMGSVIETALIKPIGAAFGALGAYPTMLSEFWDFVSTGSLGARDRASSIVALIEKDMSEAVDSFSSTLEVASKKRQEFIVLREKTNKAAEGTAQGTPEERRSTTAQKVVSLEDKILKIQKEQDKILGSQESRAEKIRNFKISELSQYEQINARAQTQVDLLQKEHDSLLKIFESNMDRLVNEKLHAKERIELQKTQMLLHEEMLQVFELQDIAEKERLSEVKELVHEFWDSQRAAAEEQAAFEKELHEQKIAQIRSGIEVSISGLQSFAASGMELMELTANKNKDLYNVLFRISQAASLAEIAMSTAQAIAAAPAQYGPLAPLAVASIVAGGAAQSAVVLAQSPPAHMGGYISDAPDERKRTVLTGEAVIDRATVSRLGGDQGISDLQNGKSSAERIIIMNPWKHLDRYNRSAIKAQNSSLRMLSSSTGSGGY